MASPSTRSKKPLPEQKPESQTTRAKWNVSLTNTFVDMMVEQVQKGNKEKKSLSKQAWISIYDEFRNKTGFDWDIERLKSKYVALRKHYAMIKTLLEQDEFKWNEITGVIVATDESWDKYIEEHPDCESLRVTGCPLYKQLCIIYCPLEISVKCNGSKSSTLNVQNSSIFQDDLMTTESEEINDTADEQENFQLDNASTSVSRKRGRKGVDDVIAKAILEMAAASKLKTMTIKKINEKYSISDCVKVLDELQGVNEDIYYAALNLFDSRVARETFLSLKVDKRLTWLSGKCLAKTISPGVFNI